MTLREIIKSLKNEKDMDKEILFYNHWDNSYQHVGELKIGVVNIILRERRDYESED